MKSNPRILIRWVPGRHGGWTVSCPSCPSLVVRQCWAEAIDHADRHMALHQRPLFTVAPLDLLPRMGQWDGYHLGHFDNLYPIPRSETHHQ